MLLLLLLRTTTTRAMGEGERERSWGRKIRKQNLVYRRRSGLGSRDFVPARTTPRSHMGMGGEPGLFGRKRLGGHADATMPTTTTTTTSTATAYTLY